MKCEQELPEYYQPTKMWDFMYWPGVPTHGSPMPDVHNINIQKRSERTERKAHRELEMFFATLPDSDSLDATANKGAALVHKHMSIPIALSVQARTLHHAFQSILNRSNHRARRGKKSVPKDVLVKALYQSLVKTAPEKKQKGMDILVGGAIMKAVRERATAGKHGAEDIKLIHHLFDKVHGPRKGQHVEDVFAKVEKILAKDNVPLDGAGVSAAEKKRLIKLLREELQGDNPTQD
ncbi:uncharacterized protein LTR77_000928 [Saxophila tyrrhenica]|uniref:Uncharacterized protein n=1 Tax=Saxophila tyrrhenica TaxID=1690608 RepID=A0AAV9PRB5_9PEZI|nr:hypothetical protein LTR77_000928 [Saxophila tyrrhenica]